MCPRRLLPELQGKPPTMPTHPPTHGLGREIQPPPFPWDLCCMSIRSTPSRPAPNEEGYALTCVRRIGFAGCFVAGVQPRNLALYLDSPI